MRANTDTGSCELSRRATSLAVEALPGMPTPSTARP